MSRGFFKALSLACALAVLAAASANAQQEGNRQRGQGGPGGFGMFGGGFGGVDIFAVLKNDKVKEDLELTAEQVAALGKLEEEGRAARRTGGGGGAPGGFDRNASEEERNKAMAELRARMAERNKETRKKVDAALLAPQVARLSEILIQSKGTAALQEEEVKKTLGITEDQTKAFAKVREDSGAKMRELFQPGGDRDAARGKMAEITKETEAATLAVLTADQKAKFEKMKGDKLDVDWAAVARAGFGGGGRPGGEGGNRPRRPDNIQ